MDRAWLTLGSEETMNMYSQGILRDVPNPLPNPIDSLAPPISIYARGTQRINTITTLNQTMQTQVADWLRNISLNFNGRVMRNSSGTPYMIIFFS